MNLIIKSLKTWIHPVLFFFLISFITYNCKSDESGNILIKTHGFIYEIGKDGTNFHFIDKKTGVDYLAKENDSKCAYIIFDGQQYDITSLSLKKGHLYMDFGISDIQAVIEIKRNRDNVRFRVVTVNGEPESLVFLNVPLNLEGMPYEPFAACVLSMNLYTHVRQLPALQTQLRAACYQRFGFEGAEITLIGVPGEKMTATIRKVIKNADDIPFSDKGGAWALMQKEGYGSYLMNFGTLTEETIDDWISMCRNLGFNQIDNHGGGSFFRFGDFVLNKEKWPEGWEAFKRINARLHDEGISSIFHTYAFFIDKNSEYVSPVPHENLGSFRSFTLARPVNEDDTEIVVEESTEDISIITGFFVRNSLSLRIGTELIEFSDVTRVPPYTFTGCRRGVLGTKASPHAEGDTAFHLREMFGRFVPDPESPLFDEIAKKTANIVSECNFDGLYFDAIDGSDILGGEENFWYYGTKFIFEVARHLKKPVGMEMSSMSHHWWHYRSRWQAWDRPVRGYKRFVDIHSAAIKSTRLFLPAEIRSNENEHGLWRGHTPLIDKYAAVENGSLLLPLHFGWWGNQTWNPPQVEISFPDDIEYLCCKMIGNNAGLSMLGGVDEKTLAANPLFKRLIPIIKQYEELRHENYFNDSVRALLRQPGKEFSLFKEENGKWNFKPVSYDKHKVSGLNHPSAEWKVKNNFREQAVKLRLEALMSVKPFNDPDNVVLAEFHAPGEFKYEGSAQGISGDINTNTGKTGEPTGIFYANNSSDNPREGMWIKMEKKFEPSLNIINNKALGVWVKGDGNGQLLNLRLESPKHLSHGARGDHFIKIDFSGWKYFELVEIESSEFSNYIWPDSGFYVYDSYRHQVNFNYVDKLQLWYNNLPPGKEVNCEIGRIKALQMVPFSISKPALTIGDDTIIFQANMESGMYLEFMGANDCKLYGPKGEFIQDVNFEGNIPVLKKGDNVVSFSCNGPQEINTRMQITVISEDKALDINN